MKKWCHDIINAQNNVFNLYSNGFLLEIYGLGAIYFYFLLKILVCFRFIALRSISLNVFSLFFPLNDVVVVNHLIYLIRKMLFLYFSECFCMSWIKSLIFFLKKIIPCKSDVPWPRSHHITHQQTNTFILFVFSI